MQRKWEQIFNLSKCLAISLKQGEIEYRGEDGYEVGKKRVLWFIST